MKKIKILFVLLCCTQVTFGQSEAYELPIYFGQYFNDPQINSLKFDESQDLKFVLGHRRNNNNFGGINTSIFSFQYFLKTKENGNHHSFGLKFVNDKEGFIIRRNRAYLNYGYHLKISDKFKFAGQFSGGFYNFSVQANDVTGGYSNFAFDGDLTMSLYSEKTEITVGMNQIPNSRIQPVDQSIILGRHLNILLKRNFVLGDNVEIAPTILTRYSKKNASIFSGFGGTLGFQFKIKQIFTAGMSVEHRNGLYFFAGLKNIKMKDSFMHINLSYFTPTYKSSKTNIQLFEVFIGYDINFKKV